MNTPLIARPGYPCLSNVAEIDRGCLPLIASMHRYGTAIDIPYLHALSDLLSTRMIELREDILQAIPLHVFEQMVADETDWDDLSDINIDSPDQLSTLLFDLMHVGRGHNLKLTKSQSRISTGKKQLETIKSTHPIIPLILQYRECAKLKNTYTDKLPLVARLHPAGDCPICESIHAYPTHRVHTTFTTTRTATGRLASKSPNLQNIPARTELGRMVRAAFIASPGKRIVQRDLSQIELRFLAHCSADSTMIDIYKRDGDIHLETACAAFNLPEDQIDKLLHRAPCKNVNFGVVYGLSAVGLYDQMALTYATARKPLPPHITEKWCEDFIEKWFGIYKSVRPYMQRQVYRAYRYGIVWDIFGRVRPIPEITSVHSRVRAAGERQAGNMPIQSAAAAVMKIAMARCMGILDYLNSAIPLLTVHDELLWEVDEDGTDLLDSQLEEAMNGAVEGLLVEIKSDGAVMDRWVKE